MYRMASVICLFLLGASPVVGLKKEDLKAQTAVEKLASDSAAVLLDQVSHETDAAAERLQSDVTMVLKKLAGNSMYDFKVDLADVMTSMIMDMMKYRKPQLPTDGKAKEALGKLPMDALKGLKELAQDKTLHEAEADAKAMIKSLYHDAVRGKPLDKTQVSQLSSDAKAALQEVAQIVKDVQEKAD